MLEINFTFIIFSLVYLYVIFFSVHLCHSNVQFEKQYLIIPNLLIEIIRSQYTFTVKFPSAILAKIYETNFSICVK